MYEVTRRQVLAGMLGLGAVGIGGAGYAVHEYHLLDSEPLVNPNPKQQVGRLTQDNLTEIIEASEDTPTMIKFTAKWCRPCRVLKPVYEGVASEYHPDEIRFLEYDIDNNTNYFKGTPLAELPIKPSIPRIAVLYGKRVVKVFDGNDLAEGRHTLISEAAYRAEILAPILTRPAQLTWKHHLMKQLEREIVKR